MNLQYLNATPDDFDVLAEIRLEAMRESLESVGRFNRERSIERFRAAFTPEYTQKVLINDVLAGFYSVSVKKDHLHLDHLYILPEFQSGGIGSEIMTRVFEQSLRRHLPIRLAALRGSRSNQFYQRHGFVFQSEDEWDLYYERPVHTWQPNAEIDPTDFLSGCDFIDITNPEIVAKATSLAGDSEEATARRCFEFVRDDVQHSFDYQRNPVTCRASDVLNSMTGYCYAKSHLLCALLRVNQVPAGLCYQRLSIGGDGPPFSLHGLNAIFLKSSGWYRVDARGNRTDVNAQFSPPIEQLAFPISMKDETDFPEIWQSPHPAVIECLLHHDDWESVYKNLPDEYSQDETMLQ